MVAAITLLPAILGMVGDRIDRLALPAPARRRRTTTRTAGRAGRGSWPGARSRARVVALVVLLALALPTLDLYLGQQDNGALPKSTEARQSYDGMTAAFGVGANGPLLVSVDMSKQPAKPDQSKLDQLNKQESDQKAQASQKAQAQIASLEAEGVPPDQAQAQVQPQLDKQLSRSPTRRRRSASSSTRTRPTRGCRSCARTSSSERREEGDAAARQQGRARAAV